MYKLKIAMTEKFFMEVIVYNDIVDYFSGVETLNKLVFDGFARDIIVGGAHHYTLTKRGVEVTEPLISEIPEKTKNTIDEHCDKLLRGEFYFSEVRTQVVARSEGVYYLKCGVYEWGAPVFEVNVRTNDIFQAERLQKYFRRNSTIVHHNVFRVLGEPIDGTTKLAK
jgi:hypothetical protein